MPKTLNMLKLRGSSLWYPIFASAASALGSVADALLPTPVMLTLLFSDSMTAAPSVYTGGARCVFEGRKMESAHTKRWEGSPKIRGTAEQGTWERDPEGNTATRQLSTVKRAKNRHRTEAEKRKETGNVEIGVGLFSPKPRPLTCRLSPTSRQDSCRDLHHRRCGGCCAAGNRVQNPHHTRRAPSQRRLAASYSCSADSCRLPYLMTIAHSTRRARPAITSPGEITVAVCLTGG
jgi:hypothetical protein